MYDPHKNPNYILTSYFGISHIFISHDSSHVALLGCYGDMLDGGMPTICIETDFARLNDLLAQAGEEAESAINEISKCLVNPSEEPSIIDLCDEGGLSFSDHLFSFVMMEEEEVKLPGIEEYTYRLLGWIDREEIIDDFAYTIIPESGNDRLVYLNSLLGIQYRFYLAFRKKTEYEEAVAWANLGDAVCFEMGGAVYERQMRGKVKGDKL